MNVVYDRFIPQNVSHILNSVIFGNQYTVYLYELRAKKKPFFIPFSHAGRFLLLFSFLLVKVILAAYTKGV